MTDRRVLIIEDDGILRDAYRLALGRAGYCVIEADAGQPGLHLISSADGDERIDLVVLDMGLPDMDGLEVLETIRQKHDDRSLPVLVVTGADELEERVHGLVSGANDYVSKPVALAELVARVDAHVRTSDHWRAQVHAVRDTRQLIAEDLADLPSDGDLTQAATVIVRAASRIPDVAGAAFLIDGDTTTTCTAGAAPTTPGSPLSPRLVHAVGAAELIQPTVMTAAAVGLPGDASLALVPLVMASHRAGVLLAALTDDLPTLRADAALGALVDLGKMATPVMTPFLDRARALAAGRDEVTALIEAQAFDTLYQPIVELDTGRTVGFEALTRFDDGRRPDHVFASAGAVGLRPELEQAAALAAVARSSSLPDGAYVSVNVSAATATDRAFLADLITGERDVVIEITEHDVVEDYAVLAAALDTVRDHVRLAVDDAGAGYAGLHHIRQLRPDVLKLDRSLISGIAYDPVGRAMVTGLVYFANEVHCSVVAEGIETAPELDALIDLRVTHGQGYLLGRPEPAPEDGSTLLDGLAVTTGSVR